MRRPIPGRALTPSALVLSGTLLCLPPRAPALAQGQAPGPAPSPVPTAPADPVDPGDGPVRSASVRCTDFTIRFLEADVSQPYPPFPVGGDPILDPKGASPGGREVTAQFACHGDGGFLLPTVTSIHMLEARDGLMCHRVRSCGNLRHMGGFFGLSVGWSRQTALGEFVVSRDFVRQSVDYDGLSLTLSAYVSFDQFDRYCGAPSEPLCL